MQLTAAIRITGDAVRKRSLRENYWAMSKNATRWLQLRRPENREFARHAWQDLARFASGRVSPVTGEIRLRAKAAVQWLLLAQEMSGNGGVSLGYFPCEEATGWRQAYPETTGYIITSLLEYARKNDDALVRARAIDMAEWELRIQMPSGAVQGGMLCPPEQQTPCVFNTGMVVDGWCSAFHATGDDRFLRAALRASDFLIADLTPDGYFRTNGQFVTPGTIKTYNVLCAWAMYRVGEHSKQQQYKDAALRVVEAALRQQGANGWFANNCLTRPDAPLLHTISYTLQGVLEVGLLSGRPDFIAAVRKGLDPVLERMSQAGFLHGRYFQDWKPAVFSSCLTGSAQTAIVSYRMFEHSREQRYRDSADRILNYVKALQELNSADKGVVGALAGSFPLFGEYMTGGYPNWATKYLLDALMLQERLSA